MAVVAVTTIAVVVVVTVIAVVVAVAVKPVGKPFLSNIFQKGPPHSWPFFVLAKKGACSF